jgi:hypothetical protein
MYALPEHKAKSKVEDINCFNVLGAKLIKSCFKIQSIRT